MVFARIQEHFPAVIAPMPALIPSIYRGISERVTQE
jgi:hypothetical protein